MITLCINCHLNLQIVAISGFVHPKVDLELETTVDKMSCFTVIRKLDDAPFPLDLTPSLREKNLVGALDCLVLPCDVVSCVLLILYHLRLPPLR